MLFQVWLENLCIGILSKIDICLCLNVWVFGLIQKWVFGLNSRLWTGGVGGGIAKSSKTLLLLISPFGNPAGRNLSSPQRPRPPAPRVSPVFTTARARTRRRPSRSPPPPGVLSVVVTSVKFQSIFKMSPDGYATTRGRASLWGRAGRCSVAGSSSGDPRGLSQHRAGPTAPPLDFRNPEQEGNARAARDGAGPACAPRGAP